MFATRFALCLLVLIAGELGMTNLAFAQENDVTRFLEAGPAAKDATARGKSDAPASSEGKEARLKYDKQASEAVEQYFEEQFQTAAVKSLARARQRLQRRAAIEGVTPDEYEATWRVELNIVDRPAGEVLTDQFALLGVPLVAEPETAKQLERRITVRCRGCSRLEAIERVCERAGVYADYTGLGQGEGGALLGAMALLFCPPTSGNATPGDEATRTAAVEKPTENIVRLRAGPRPSPLTFAGPCAIELVGLDERAPYGSGTLDVRIHTVGLPASVAARQEMNGSIETHFKAIQDQADTRLAIRPFATSSWLDLLAIQSQNHYWELSNLLRESTTVKIAGTVRIPVSERVESIELKELKAGASATGGGWRLEISSVKLALGGFQAADIEKRKSYTVSLRIAGSSCPPADFARQLVFFDSQGRGLEVKASFISRGGYGVKESDPYIGEFTVTGEPVSALVKVFSEPRLMEYPFELVASLHSSTKQPLEPVKLEFKGAAPVSIEVQELVRDEPFPKLKTLLMNHSNKDVDSLSYTLIYVDAANRQLKTFPGHFSAGLSTNDKPAVGIGRAAERVHEASAAFMPKSAVQVRISLTTVRFMDGSTWQPPRPMKQPVEPTGPTTRTPQDSNQPEKFPSTP